MLAVLLISISALSPVSADNHVPLPDLLKTLTQGADNTSFDPALPPPEQAYIVSISQLDEAKLRATWNIDQCCYMYRERFAFSSETPGFTLGEPLFPEGKIYEDEFYGETEIYRGQISIDIPFQQSVSSSQLEVKANFQGCADIGVCYPPQEQTVPVILRQTSDNDTNAAKAATTMTAPTSAIESSPQVQSLTSKQITPSYVSEQDAIADTLIQQRYWALPLFFGFGLLLAFTPCVFPMIPILSGIIMGQQNLTQWRAFRLSAVYVLAMALTYTVAGVMAALLGQNVQVWFQNPWVLTAFSALFVALALAMFGLYSLQMPLRIQNWLNTLSNRQRSGRYAGVALMGVLSALIVGPCVAAPLIGVLAVIGSTGDVSLGGSALFVMSLGMGAPLLLIGTSAGRWLPKVGPWMSAIKSIFGVLMLAVAIWLLERILPETITMLLWAALLIVSAVFMGVGRVTQGSGFSVLSKGFGVVILVYGVLLLVGVAAGGKDPLQPLRGTSLVADKQGVTEALVFQRIKTVADLEQAIAGANGSPVMLDFYADWCISCKEMERYTFSNRRVQATLAGTRLLKADVTANDALDQALLRRFNLIGPPAILFFTPDGRELSNYRVVGFMAAEDFSNHLDQVAQTHRTLSAERALQIGMSSNDGG